MAEHQIRKLKAAGGFKTLRVPVGYDQNVGTRMDFVPGQKPPEGMSDLEAEVLGRKGKAHAKTFRGAGEDEVSQHADYLAARFQLAQESANKLMAKIEKKRANGEAVKVADDELAKPFNDLIDHVRTVGVNASKPDGGDPTIVADVASALTTLDPQTRDMVLRRAGNPAVFEDLRGGELAEPPADGIGDKVRKESAAAAVTADEKQIKTQNSTKALPQIKRPSSVFSRPDSLVTRGENKGKVKDSSDQYKSYTTRDISPLDVSPDAKDSTKREALWTLAGDQLKEIRGIQNRILQEQGWSDDQIGKLSAKDREQLFPRDQMNGVRLPPAVGKDVGPAVLKTGTDPNYHKPSDRKYASADNSAATTDKVVEGRNRGSHAKLLEMMYSKTMPKPATDPVTGDAIINRKASVRDNGLEAMVSMAEPHDTVIDLDRHFPWWRGRFAEMDDSGNLAYPAKMPSAEFVTGMIEGQLGVQDPEFFTRMLPLVKRSIDAAPEAPDPNYRPEGGRGRTAHQYSQTVFLPSEQFAETMKSGVGHPDYPYPIYGDREVPRDEVTAPERHPFAAQSQTNASEGIREFKKLMEGGAMPQESAAPEVDSGVEEFRRLMQDRPALGDQSSIYRVRPASPLSALFA